MEAPHLMWSTRASGPSPISMPSAESYVITFMYSDRLSLSIHVDGFKFVHTKTKKILLELKYSSVYPFKFIFADFVILFSCSCKALRLICSRTRLPWTWSNLLMPRIPSISFPLRAKRMWLILLRVIRRLTEIGNRFVTSILGLLAVFINFVC